MQLTVTTLPVKKSSSETPAGVSELQIKIILPLFMRKANAERIFDCYTA